MKPEERENMHYLKGKENEIAIEENLLFSLLPKNNANINKKILDIGCGVGSISIKLKDRGFIVTGVDFSTIGIEKAKERGIDAILTDIDKSGLNFQDNYFDVVWAGDIIEHVFDPIFLFKEINRVLKKDGILLLTTPNDFNLYSRLLIFLKGKSIQSGIYRKLKMCKHHTFFSWELLEYMFRSAGFVLNYFSSVLIFPRTNIEIITKNKTLGRLFGRIFIISLKIK
jgi:2-polyprenyl-3-methyl-5-hydroxy-6-metoxy-1,4-benzoquinol methylase